jgi:hypothetical protein
MADALVITRWFRVINDAEMMQKRNALLKETAEKYAAKARALSAVPKGLGTGVKSGPLPLVLVKVSALRFALTLAKPSTLPGKKRELVYTASRPIGFIQLVNASCTGSKRVGLIAAHP